MPSTKKGNNEPSYRHPGKLIEVGSHRLHFYCKGPLNITDKYMPTVVIEAGCGWHSTMYYWLQEKLSQSLRVCSYDRAGLGWSEDSHHPRDAEQISKQLHSLLNKADINGPIILVGHSIAGLYLRVYANKYPENIVGMVFLDSSHPRQNEILPVSGFTRRQRLHNKLMAVYTTLGISRFYNPLWELENTHTIYLPYSVQKKLAYLYTFRQSYTTPLIEFDSFEMAATQALNVGDLGDLPLLVITAPSPDTNQLTANWKKHMISWSSLQRDLLSLSSNSHYRIIENSGHCTLLTKQKYATQVSKEILILSKQLY